MNFDMMSQGRWGKIDAFTSVLRQRTQKSNEFLLSPNDGAVMQPFCFLFVLRKRKLVSDRIVVSVAPQHVLDPP